MVYADPATGRCAKMARPIEVNPMSIHDIRDHNQQPPMAGRRPTTIARAKVYEAPKAPPVPAWLPLLLLLQAVAAFWFLFQIIR